MILGPWRLPKSQLWGYYERAVGCWVWRTVGTYEDTLATIRHFRTVR